MINKLIDSSIKATVAKHNRLEKTMKSTQKYVEIMEKLTGISVGSQVVFKEATYTVSGINTDEIEAKVILTSEGKNDIELTLKGLIESEEYVIEAKCKEEMDGEEDGEKEKEEDGEEKEMEEAEEAEETEEEEEDAEMDEEDSEEDSEEDGKEDGKEDSKMKEKKNCKK